MTNTTVNTDLLVDAIEYGADRAGQIARAEMELIQQASAKMTDHGSSAQTGLVFGASLMEIVGPHVHDALKSAMDNKGLELSDEDYITAFKDLCSDRIDQSFNNIVMKRGLKAQNDKEMKLGITRK